MKRMLALTALAGGLLIAAPAHAATANWKDCGVIGSGNYVLDVYAITQDGKRQLGCRKARRVARQATRRPCDGRAMRVDGERWRATQCEDGDALTYSRGPHAVSLLFS